MDPSILNGSYLQYGVGPAQPYSNNDKSEERPSSSCSPGGTPNISLVLTVRLLMQGKEVGSIIGKRGDQVKKIREESGAKVNISDGSSPERIVTITGSLNTINKAFDMICAKFEEDMLALPNSVPKPPITMRMIVPATQCGSLIGKGGTKIKEIREVASEMLPQSTERAVTISGTADAIVLCMQQVCQILLEAPPKGATLSYRPKPSFNPLLVASSAAAAAAQQQQLAATSLLSPGLSNQNFQAQLQAQLQQELAAAHGLIQWPPVSGGWDPRAAAQQFATQQLAAQQAAVQQHASQVQQHKISSQGLQMYGGGGGGGGGAGMSGMNGQESLMLDPQAQLWLQQQEAQKQQMELMQQYAALSSSVLMGAPLLKGTSPPTGPAHHQPHHAAKNPAPTRYAPY